MKKKLEAELISIAHRILKLKNKSELIQLHQETQKLYEKLSVLRFVEEHFGAVKPTIGLAEIEKKLETVFEEETIPAEVTPTALQIKPETLPESIVLKQEVPESELTPEIIPEKAEEIPLATEKELVPEVIEEAVFVPKPEAEKEPEAVVAETSFKPAFDLAFEPKIETVKEEAVKEEIKKAPTQISFEDLLGPNYSEPVFVKAEEQMQKIAVEPVPAPLIEEIVVPVAVQEEVVPVTTIPEMQAAVQNDRSPKVITIGLNDRIGFEKQLFGGSGEDLNRVLSQLSTFDTFQEAQDFIEEMVKPDYNNWDGKEEYAQRFMEIVEKKFV